MENKGPIFVTLKVGGEMKCPARPLFSSFPRFRVVELIKDGKRIDTQFWPTAGSLPGTRHNKTIRYININWNGCEVKAEYDDVTKLIKVTSGNVDSVRIEVI